jgi:hypothetical protein
MEQAMKYLLATIAIAICLTASTAEATGGRFARQRFFRRAPARQVFVERQVFVRQPVFARQQFIYVDPLYAPQVQFRSFQQYSY